MTQVETTTTASIIDNEDQQKKAEKDKLPEDIQQDISTKKDYLEKKASEIQKSNLVKILEDENLSEKDLINRIRELPFLTKDDHKIIDQIDKSKFRLWLMKESQNDMFGIKCKKVKTPNPQNPDEVEYEEDDKGKIILVDEPFFYSPFTNHQKKIIRRLEMVANMSAAAYNKKNIECIQMQIQNKTETKEYFDAMEEREKLQSIYNNNIETLNQKVAYFRLGVKPEQFDHLVETDLLRYLQVAQYKESLANPQ